MKTIALLSPGPRSSLTALLLASLAAVVGVSGCVTSAPEEDIQEESSERVEQSLVGPVSVGLHAPQNTPTDTAAREAALGGAHFDHVLVFQFVHWTHNSGWSDVSNKVQPHLDAGRDVV
ncbi:MAG: hypothetical protein ABI134_23815, partial [Byssovorax sp.]